jgi:lysyl-tRNA synthetase class 2
MEKAVRAWFDEEGFIQVTTPVAVSHPNLDPNVLPVPVTVRDFHGDPVHLWLHTSPELSMKKLLAAGSGSIYQIGPVFRDGERTRLHRCEFTMLEWYRVDADYEDAIRDTIRVFRAAMRAVTGGDEVVYRGLEFDLSEPWEELTMAQAFQRYAGLESWDAEEMRRVLGEMGHVFEPESTVEDLFFHLYLEKVEPELGMLRPAIVKDFPAFLGTMAEAKPESPAVLERFEVYIGGVELANGYTESRNPMILRERMEKAARSLALEGAGDLPVDERFLDAIREMPPCAGVSVGMDRLAMIALDADDISQVVYPFEEKTD